MSSGFLNEPIPARDVPQPVLPGIRRIVADNPGPMSYHGTNTYLLDDDDDRFIVIDPGPDDARHVDAIVGATSGRVSRILLTHTHHDHLGATAALKAATGAPTYGYHVSAEANFAADVLLRDGAQVGSLTAVHTPGHAPDHLCFARQDCLLFTGDHVMGWSSSIVNPPKGEMLAYFSSLRLLLARNDQIYLPGHGPMIGDPHGYVRALLFHREQRERAILQALRGESRNTFELMDRLYSKIDPTLRWAAERNVIAHLLKLESEGHAMKDRDRWRARS
jgi:glyoxylase-like metal-dependent hydrolase (beta-lactamase superfamily II)